MSRSGGNRGNRRSSQINPYMYHWRSRLTVHGIITVQQAELLDMLVKRNPRAATFQHLFQLAAENKNIDPRDLLDLARSVALATSRLYAYTKSVYVLDARLDKEQEGEEDQFIADNKPPTTH